MDSVVPFSPNVPPPPLSKCEVIDFLHAHLYLDGTSGDFPSSLMPSDVAHYKESASRDRLIEFSKTVPNS